MPLRTAICLSGHLRLFKDNIEPLKKYLLRNPDLDCDIFIHTWRRADRGGNPVTNIEVIEAYKPKKIVIEPFIRFDITPLMKEAHDKHIDINGIRDINGMLSMFYKIKSCNDLKLKYEQENNFKYDCVIRLRPDIQLTGNVPIDLSTDLTKLYIPKHGDYSGINDQFAYSNSQNMDIYSSTFNHIERYLTKGLMMNPEQFTLETIKENNIIIERPEILYNIVWFSGISWTNLTR